MAAITYCQPSFLSLTIVPQNKAVFFETTDFPDPTGPSLAGFMIAKTGQKAGDKRMKQLLYYCLDLVMNPRMGQEAAVDNFAAEASSTMMNLGLSSSGEPSLFLFVVITQPLIPTFASWTIIKFCCSCRKTRNLRT